MKIAVRQKRKRLNKSFFIGFNRGFDNLTSKYLGGIQLLIRYKWVSMAGLVLITLATVVLVNRTKTGFIPSEDQGFMAISVSMPGGTSLDRTIKNIDEAERILMQLPSAKTVNAMSGFNVMTQSTNPSSGVIFLLLKPAKERGPISDINAIMAEVNQKLSVVKGVNFFCLYLPYRPGI